MQIESILRNLYASAACCNASIHLVICIFKVYTILFFVVDLVIDWQLYQMFFSSRSYSMRSVCNISCEEMKAHAGLRI